MRRRANNGLCALGWIDGSNERWYSAMADLGVQHVACILGMRQAGVRMASASPQVLVLCSLRCNVPECCWCGGV